MPPQRRRLDAELVRRKIARSREQAVEMIKSGRVTVGGFKASKPATVVEPEVSIKVEESEGDDWASRGAHKLLGALEAFDVDVSGRRVLDAGASTGGFTDVCLRRGAAGCSPWTSVTASFCGACRTMSASPCWTGRTFAT